MLSSCGQEHEKRAAEYYSAGSGIRVKASLKVQRHDGEGRGGLIEPHLDSSRILASGKSSPFMGFQKSGVFGVASFLASRLPIASSQPRFQPR